MRAIIPKRVDKLRLASLGGTFQNPEPTEPSQLWGKSFDFTELPIDEEGAYEDGPKENEFARLNGDRVENLSAGMKLPNYRFKSE